MTINEAKAISRKKWYAKNRERVKAYYKKWRKNNPDKVAEYQRKYWERKAAEYEKSISES